ncbi:hypothetical protein B0A48_13659 [Cryoendolithus antarcticus]|uniref:Uncharacterized protein n=1 Tax=Cryoendolithus antarcticus TaxID=1507870 RepID=A0A1V8SPI8_9PEZI|nr:hypothetical protein B0A48_13659 [Cryoendolithus antarcticus]
MPILNDLIIVLVWHDDQVPIVEHDFSLLNTSPAPANVTSVHCAFPPLTRFQIHYSCPPQSLLCDVKYFYFKLFLDGAHIASWDCGPAHEWEGIVEFIPRSDGEKYGLMFEELGQEVKVLELRVFRATARKSENLKVDKLKCEKEGKGSRFPSIGALHPEDPRTFYKYALLDAVDAPHATFQFQCCSPDRLRALGVAPETDPVGFEDTTKRPTVRSVQDPDGPRSEEKDPKIQTPSPNRTRESSAHGTSSPSKPRSPRAALLEQVVARSLKRTVHASRQIVKGYEKPV